MRTPEEERAKQRFDARYELELAQREELRALERRHAEETARVAFETRFTVEPVAGDGLDEKPAMRVRFADDVGTAPLTRERVIEFDIPDDRASVSAVSDALFHLGSTNVQPHELRRLSETVYARWRASRPAATEGGGS